MTMRITFVGPVPPISSGPAQHGGYLANALARRSEVTVLSWQHQYPKALFKHAQRDPNATPHPGARFSLRWWDPLSWWRAGRRLAKSDIAVMTWVTPFHALPYRVMMLGAGKTTFVAMAHNAIPHERLPFQEKLTRWILGRCKGIVTHSITVANELAELTPDVPTTTTPLPPHIPVERQSLPDLDDGQMRLLFFGFVRPYKGLDVALEALAQLADKDVRPRLTIVGEFWQPVENFQDEVARLGLADQVDIHPGYLADDQVSDLLAAHHAMLLPYRSASQSGIVPVALKAGRPVIATAVGGISEAVTDGVNGALAQPGDADSLAAAIERCGADLDALAEGTQKTKLSYDDVAAAVLAAAGGPPT